MSTSLVLFAYLGPDTMLPVASVLAAIIGFLLVCWNYVVAFVRRVFRLVTGRKDPPSELDGVDSADPHSGT